VRKGVEQLRGCVRRRLGLPAGSCRIRIDPVPKFFGDEVDADAARAVVEITENAFAVAKGTQHSLVLLGRLDTQEGQDVPYLGTFR
jgi:hypothetical protein